MGTSFNYYDEGDEVTQTHTGHSLHMESYDLALFLATLKREGITTNTSCNCLEGYGDEASMTVTLTPEGGRLININSAYLDYTATYSADNRTVTLNLKEKPRYW